MMRSIGEFLLILVLCSGALIFPLLNCKPGFMTKIEEPVRNTVTESVVSKTTVKKKRRGLLFSSVPMSQKEILRYAPGDLGRLAKQKRPAFIHFTGDACLQCIVEWALVDEEKLKKQADLLGFELYEAKLETRDFEYSKGILRDLLSVKRFGVPVYVFVDSKGNFHVIDHVTGEDTIIDKMKELNG